MMRFESWPIWWRWVIVVLIGLLGGAVISISYTNCLPLMTLIIEDLKLTYAQGGWLLSSVFLTMTIFFIPCGLASDRWGRKKFVVLSLFLTTMGSLALAWCSSFSSAIATRVVIGIGYAMFVGPGVAMIANWFSSRQLGFAIGIWLTGYFLGMLLGEFVPPLLVGFGWRNAIWMTSVPGLVIVLLCLIFTKDKPEEVGLPSPENISNNKEEAGVSLEKENSLNQSPSGREKLSGYKVLKNKDLWICGLWCSGAYAGLSGIATWLPTFTNQVHGISYELAGLITGLATGGIPLIIVMPAGIISDWIKRRLPLMISTNIILGIFIICIVYSSIGSLWLLIVFAILIGIGASLGIPAGIAYPPEIAGLKSAGSAVNMIEAIGSGGGLIAPWIMGVLFDTYHSWTVSFLFIGIWAIISGLVCFLAKETKCTYLRY